MGDAAECKKTAKVILQGCGLVYDRLSAKTVSFEDLARASCVFVTVTNARPADGIYGAFDLAKAQARDHGFRITYGR